MKGDDRAVGGFFEDLAVMVFILAGVSLLVSSYVWSHSLAHAQEEQERLDTLAERYVNGVIISVEEASHGSLAPSLAVLRALDLSGLANSSLPGQSLVSSISALHPYSELIVSFSSAASPIPRITGYFAALANALDANGMVVVVEVRCIVW